MFLSRVLRKAQLQRVQLQWLTEPKSCKTSRVERTVEAAAASIPCAGADMCSDVWWFDRSESRLWKPPGGAGERLRGLEKRRTFSQRKITLLTSGPNVRQSAGGNAVFLRPNVCSRCRWRQFPSNTRAISPGRWDILKRPARCRCRKTRRVVRWRLSSLFALVAPSACKSWQRLSVRVLSA